MKIVLYTTTTSPYGKMLKDYFKTHNFSFTEKMIDQDEMARQEMAQESGGFLGVPFTVIVKDDNSKEKIIGFNKGKMSKVLAIG